jgi:hypothetical protein
MANLIAGVTYHVERRINVSEWHECGKCGRVEASMGAYVLHDCASPPAILRHRLLTVAQREAHARWRREDRSWLAAERVARP